MGNGIHSEYILGQFSTLINCSTLGRITLFLTIRLSASTGGLRPKHA